MFTDVRMHVDHDTKTIFCTKVMKSHIKVLDQIYLGQCCTRMESEGREANYSVELQNLRELVKSDVNIEAKK